MQIVLLILSLLTSSVGSILMAYLIFYKSAERYHKIIDLLVNYASGILLGAIFLALLPEAVEAAEPHNVFITVLVFTLFLFILEKIILWRVCNDENCSRHNSSAAHLVIIGDFFHNTIDGVVLASSYLVSIELGIMITISIVLHEIPQEMGDFSILLKSGYTKKKALTWNIISGTSAIISGILAFYFLGSIQQLTPYALSLSAASFIYLVYANLIPEMHKSTKPKDSLYQILFIILGIITIVISHHHH
ncbi:MAG TPA: ZIP family metal transporter [Ignavibacteriales bacterium]|nr:ZIP family metal transporter [Ignavibacteriales bacterium]